MPSAKRVLGRGLADLIPVGGDGANNAADLGPGQELSIAMLHRNPRQPRTRFDEAALAELAESIKANGVLQPILVRPRTAGGYEIVAGERRYRAALKAGLKQVPVVVRRLSDEETLALALIENLIREDIGPMETARAFQRLMEDFGWTQEEMGKRVGKSRTAISNSLRLLSLPEDIQKSLEQGELSEGHARILIGDEKSRHLPDFRERQRLVWRQAINKGLSVREVERLMREGRGQNSDAVLPGRSVTFSAEAPPAAAERAANVSRETFAANAELRALEDRLRSALGTRVRLNGTEERGKIEIEFFSPEELDALLSRIEGPAEPPAPVPSVTPPAPPAATPAPRTAPRSRIQGLLSSRTSP